MENDDFYLVIDQRGEGQIIKEVCEVLPDVSVSVFPQTLVVEAVHLGDLPRLVVPSDQGDPVWVPDLGITKDQKMFHLHSFQIKAGAPF